MYFSAPSINGIAILVLGDVTNHKDWTRLVTWSSKLDQVDVNNAKARLRHLEVVRARIHRVRALNSKQWPRGRE